MTGVRLGDAFAGLVDAGFQPVLLGLSTAKSGGEDAGYWVVAQEPAPGAAADGGSRVVLAATMRPSWGTLTGPPVAAPGTPAPDVVGRTLDEAMSSITRAGLIAVVFQPTRGVETLIVSKQEPDGGAQVGCFREVAIWARRVDNRMKQARMVFAECRGCEARIRVWDMSRGVAPSDRAATARLAAATDADRRWTCPQCGSAQSLPSFGIYVVYDRKQRKVRFVGRSVDVQRRLDWWERPASQYADLSRYRGVQLVTTGVYPDVRWLGAREAD